MATPDAPLGVITATNQSGLILILTALSLSFVLVSFAIRIYIRVPQRLWKWDDNVLTAATILSIIQTSICFYEVHLGFGKRAVYEDETPVGDLVKKYHFANDFLYLVVLLVSKLAVCFLFLRLTRRHEHLLAIYTLIGLCGAWFLSSLLLISIGSSWEKAFTISFGRWLTVGITDTVTEIMFVLFATFLVVGLRMSKVQKGTVVFTFALRLLAIPACATRLHYLSPSTLPSNRALAASLVSVCTQIQLGYGVMAASVTVLKPFMVVYEKPLGYSSYGGTGGRNGGTDGQYATSNSNRLSLKNGSAVRSSEIIPDMPMTGLAPRQIDPNQVTYSSRNPAPPREKSGRGSAGGNRTNSGGGHERDDSIHSQDSRRLIIERKTAWSIRYEEAESSKSNASEAGGSV